MHLTIFQQSTGNTKWIYKMFDQLTFNEVRKNHFQAREKFGKYNLSVILESGKSLYEIAIFEGENFVQLPGINYGDDVVPGLTKNMVTAIMQKLTLLEFLKDELHYE